MTLLANHDAYSIYHYGVDIAPLLKEREDFQILGYRCAYIKINDRYIDENDRILNESRELLAQGLEKVDEVINRLNDAARKADREDKKTCIRLANAINRLSSDLDDLAAKWNSD